MTFRAVVQSGYTGSETSIVAHGRQAPGGTPVVVCHGVLGTGTTSFASGDEGLIARRLADAHEVTSGVADLGGASTWANDASIAAVDSLVTYMGANHGTRTTRVALCGLSMGGCLALNWALRNPTKVAAVALIAPVVSLQGIHDRDPNSVAAAIETAYTNQAGYLAALPTHDPSHANYAVGAKSLGPLTRIWYSTDDTVVIPAEVLTYAGATGTRLDSMGAIGHAASSAAVSAVALWLDGFCA